MFPDMQYVRITQFMSAPIWFCIIHIAVVFYGCFMDMYLNVEVTYTYIQKKGSESIHYRSSKSKRIKVTIRSNLNIHLLSNIVYDYE